MSVFSHLPFLPAQVPLPSARINVKLASSYVAELDAIAEEDGGKLWGVSLTGPVIFVDSPSRDIVTNRQFTDEMKQPTGLGNLFTGKLPDAIPVANTSIRWENNDWTMLIWPLPDDLTDRRVLMVHEAWHRVQSQIPIPSCNVANAHLDSLLARICLQMEWKALAKALASTEEQRDKSIIDAFVFRALRRQKYPGSAIEENRMELHEGLAEYTGVRLGAAKDAKAYALRALETKPQSWPTFVRTFAYLSGPAYGLLLDEQDASWRQHLKPDSDLGEMLRVVLRMDMPTALADHAKQCIERYDAYSLVASERMREQIQEEDRRRLKARFVDGPLLVLPLRKFQMSFDPGRNTPVEGVGTVYGNLVVSDTWGKLRSTGEALITTDFKQLLVPAEVGFPESELQGKDWVLELDNAWTLKTTQEQHKWTIEPRKE